MYLKVKIPTVYRLPQALFSVSTQIIKFITYRWNFRGILIQLYQKQMCYKQLNRHCYWRIEKGFKELMPGRGEFVCGLVYQFDDNVSPRKRGSND